jgi:hypothetical protein
MLCLGAIKPTLGALTYEQIDGLGHHLLLGRANRYYEIIQSVPSSKIKKKYLNYWNFSVLPM